MGFLLKIGISEVIITPTTGLEIIIDVQPPGVARRYYI